MNFHINNLDYELALSDPHYQNHQSIYQRKIINEFEYVYFFIEKNKTELYSECLYQENYLNYLFKLGFTIPKFNKNKHNAQNWWGLLENIEKEKKLNSKITSTQLAQTNNWCHPLTQIAKNKEDLWDYITTKNLSRFLIKCPLLMSGKGHHWINKEEDNYKLSFNNWWNKYKNYGPFIIEPHLNIIVELGTTVTQNQYLFHQNFSSHRGIYRGGLCFRETSLFFNYLEKNQPIPISSSITHLFQENIKKISGHFTFNFGIDSFIYHENNELKLYSLSEINFRKSMGHMVHAFDSFIPKNGLGAWHIIPKSKKISLSFEQILHHFHSILFDGNNGLIITSPDHVHHYSFYLVAHHFEYYTQLYQQFLNKTALLS